MTNLPPGAVAGIDQELAELNSHIDHMVAAFRRKAAERGDAQTLADLAVTINDSYDGRSRGEMLAAAVLRLARGER